MRELDDEPSLHDVIFLIELPYHEHRRRRAGRSDGLGVVAGTFASLLLSM